MFAHVLLPLNLEDSYLYSVPVEIANEVAVGMRCVVQFGAKRFYVGIIASLTEDNSEAKGKKIKPLISLPDKTPIVTQEEIDFWLWAAHYYMATPGDFLRASLPTTLIPESETIVYIHLDKAEVQLPPDEALVVETLRRLYKNKIRFDLLLSNIIGTRKMKLFEALLERGILSVEEDIHKASNRIGTRCVGFTPAYRTEDAIVTLIDNLHRKPARLRLIQRLITLQEEENLSFGGLVPEKKLTLDKPSTQQLLRCLLADGILEIVYQTEPSSEKHRETSTSLEVNLPVDKPTLYIASDYKEEMHYLGQHIRWIIASGKRVLLLLPQSTILDKASGSIQRELSLYNIPICLYTSTLSMRERAALRYRMMGTDDPLLIVGSRTASLLPAHLLGLVIVAEEQDTFYKQQEPAPRYHARDLLIARAQKLGIPILLSSVTPSAESCYNVAQGKYHCINATHPVRRASIEAIDLQYERSTKRLAYGKLFTLPLREAIEQRLQRGERTIILSALRGFAPYVFCNRCHESLKCIHCSVSLTYHKRRNVLVCHYCGYTISFPSECPKCSSVGDFASSEILELKGFGSERIEDELATLYPDVPITRIDVDTFRSKEQKQSLRENLEEAASSIYVGTQMLMHFPPIKGVTLIGVTQLDRMLSISNFRTDENVFNLLYQLSVKYPDARVLLQTSDPERPLLTLLQQEKIQDNGYTSSHALFMEQLLEERCLTNFPPFVRLITIIVKATEEQDAALVVRQLSSSLQSYSSYFSAVSMPMKPYVSRVRLQYIRQITLRLQAKVSSYAIRSILRERINALRENSLEARRVRILFDVDPQN
ncbi:replication restart helicase PriA [Porphyromonas circumdentaria]|uniref:Probable replication restart protein PriA n=1 Tax=Porphyromonas circumdentaria TaxID=29524 RepID=A0A1T4MVX7_9PORP|nr:primosomal protein N' [Porphyromonas circumdentaria]MBB6275951.1 primosomal protein N' (replication factor Y) [Porphyromonas circumdentaria]MDO4721986.1 primosomal protein N' [Porphyromonas circumdentaria]SJZ71004.1 replication restart DNA helicase PriA [Porphyromonas circumdentaria]